MRQDHSKGMWTKSFWDPKSYGKICNRGYKCSYRVPWGLLYFSYIVFYHFIDKTPISVRKIENLTMESEILKLVLWWNVQGRHPSRRVLYFTTSFHVFCGCQNNLIFQIPLNDEFLHKFYNEFLVVLLSVWYSLLIQPISLQPFQTSKQLFWSLAGDFHDY